ncbi:putative arsenite efflux transporter - putative protein [Eutypa lata UCREL1]|uniref:Citrate transporter-like domain-containing protein n=1 Tax=Eutypa lata (strain UCR-EL1) TaxID=1287681 RepID=M7TJ38_EUTLA|nr:putative arsenite efflux transporter - putative protein [Eutypa lata UCREL1]
MAFFLTLAYIALSIDASGLVRYLAFVVLKKGGKVGHILFFYLYAFFFALGSFIGNDPIILSGTAFLAYMTRVSSNIVHPRAWIHSQFAIANIASAILVSSNPTNLVLAGAFSIRFIDYTANMIVPVIITAIVLFPFLLYIVFADEMLIPLEITMHELSDAQKAKPAVNPNIPHARGKLEEQEDSSGTTDQAKSLPLEEIMNPFLDKGGAAFGAIIMAATLVTVLALNASSQAGQERPIFYVTLPAAFVMFVWDVGFGWVHRNETREIARKGREEIQEAREERAAREEQARKAGLEQYQEGAPDPSNPYGTPSSAPNIHERPSTPMVFISEPSNMSTLAKPALVTKGWVQVFAYGWDHWVTKTGIVGSIGGMGFLSVVLCNFAGTNIGTTILLSRVIQAWAEIRNSSDVAISDRMFWGTVYSMALGVNYGAFSTAFSASLAGLLWRDILSRKHIRVLSREFAKVNLPIIAMAMTVGCVVLIGEIYIMRHDGPYSL